MIAHDASRPGLSAAARTDPGVRRTVNEDALLAADPCFLVADGMGGHEAGDRASRTAIAAFSTAFPSSGAATLPLIDAALDRARADVAALAATTERGAGCTLTGVIRVVHEGVPCWYVLNIGDSRVYLHRRGDLAQLTRDHSLQSEMRAQGNPDTAEIPRNVITRALGAEDSRHDAWLLPLEPGSRLLVCSDGLTTELSDAELRAVLTTVPGPDAAAEELLSRACAAGGRDNITLIVIDVDADGAPSPAEDGLFDTTEDLGLDRTLPVE